MAIHPKLHSSPSPAPGHLTPQQAHQISAWTQQAAQTVQVSATAPATGEDTSSSQANHVSLTIPLDDDHHVPNTPTPLRVRSVRVNPDSDAIPISTTTYSRRREPIRRDSLKRRDALLKGKEGSRRRQRWENDRLLNNPWAQAPSANDWQIQPTYPRHSTVPYYLAHLWDARVAAKEHSSRSSKGKSAGRADDVADIPKELRLRLKHARAARGLLQDLEEDIRRFVQKYNEKQAMLRKDGLHEAPSPLSDDENKTKTTEDDSESEDDEEDEVVFVGRNGRMHDSPERKKRVGKLKEDMGTVNEKDGEKLVFESLEEDRAAGFGRWLVHSLASYYGLRTWSVTVGNPPRREAYVGINEPDHRSRAQSMSRKSVAADNASSNSMPGHVLPRPLWISI